MVDVATDWDEKGWAAEEEEEVELYLTQQIGHAIRHGAQLVALWRLLRNNTWVVKNYVRVYSFGKGGNCTHGANHQPWHDMSSRRNEL